LRVQFEFFLLFRCKFFNFHFYPFRCLTMEFHRCPVHPSLEGFLRKKMIPKTWFSLSTRCFKMVNHSHPPARQLGQRRKSLHPRRRPAILEDRRTHGRLSPDISCQG